MAASRARFQARSCSSGFESRLLQVLSGRDHSALWASVSSLVRWKDRFSICFLGCLWEFSETLLWREQYQARPDTGLSLSSGAAVAVMQGGSLLGSGCPAPPTLPVSPNLVLKYGGGDDHGGSPGNCTLLSEALNLGTPVGLCSLVKVPFLSPLPQGKSPFLGSQSRAGVGVG